MAEKRKRRISKCECCPFYAKNLIDEKNENKWVCTNIGYVKRKKVESSDYYEEKAKICLFDRREVIYNESYREEIKELRSIIIERWLKANE